MSILSLPTGGSEGVDITSYTAAGLTLEVTAVNPRLVVVLNQFDPAWRAELDGVRVPILRTNYTFQGVVVPAGTHRVRLYYHSARGILF